MIRRSATATALLIAAALGLTVLWPGDATWLADEPRLLAEAWHANHDHELARGGLWGNFGIRYGPLPTWIYQALLLITHEPVILVAIRALLCAGTTAAALLWLARELRLPAWFAAAILAAPHVVQSHRLLWDASFAMPLGAVALAAFAHTLRTNARASLALCAGCAATLPTIHPQALPFALPLLVWLGWKQWAALRRAWPVLVPLALVLLALHARWIGDAWDGLVRNASGTVSKGYPNGASRFVCALAPLLSGNSLSGTSCLTQTGSATLTTLTSGVRVVYPLVWLGVVLAARRVVAARRVRDATPRTAVGTIALAGLALQAMLFGLMRIPAGPHYFFGTFALHAFLAWLAVDELGRLGRILGGVFGASAFAATLGIAVLVHRRGYDPALDWPTLSSQVAVARGLGAFSDATARTDVRLFQSHPQTLRALRLLLGPTPSRRSSGVLFVTRTHADRAEVELRESAERAGEPLDITPLPKGWQPSGR